jgi:vancomycin resistance protein YoaR
MRWITASREFGLLVPPVFLCLLTGLAWAWHHRPYQDLVAHYTTSVTHLSPAQRRNVRVAAAKLDGWVVPVRDRVSFNAVVGPRTTERGFGEANAYMEGARIRSIGGGVCLVASTLYAAVQQTALPIVTRVPHPVVVRAIPPGRDATVWYGQADLAFENTFDRPLKIRAIVNDAACRIELWGTAAPDQRAGLRFAYHHGRRRGDQVVRVYRHVGERTVLLSQDTYRPR